jgi:Mg-chelatase subunit ChlI
LRHLVSLLTVIFPGVPPVAIFLKDLVSLITVVFPGVLAMALSWNTIKAKRLERDAEVVRLQTRLMDIEDEEEQEEEEAHQRYVARQGWSASTQQYRANRLREKARKEEAAEKKKKEKAEKEAREKKREKTRKRRRGEVVSSDEDPCWARKSPSTERREQDQGAPSSDPTFENHCILSQYHSC